MRSKGPTVALALVCVRVNLKYAYVLLRVCVPPSAHGHVAPEPVAHSPGRLSIGARVIRIARSRRIELTAALVYTVPVRDLADV